MANKNMHLDKPRTSKARCMGETDDGKDITISQAALTRKTSEIVYNTLIFEIPGWFFADLCKIQAAQGFPLDTLLKPKLETLVIENWDLLSDGPRKESRDG